MSAIAAFTLDLEEHVPPGAPSRVVGVVGRVLDFLAEKDVVGTFFVVGDVAARHPDLVRRVAAAGHEIGFHSPTHRYLRDVDPNELRAQMTAWRARLEDLAGAEVVGYRAPYFSLTPDVMWAPAVIADAGFTYSSSVVPAHNPIAGFPDAPPAPFRWPNGLLELPCPVDGIGPARIPFAGGVYVRLLPVRLIKRFARRQSPRSVPWIYCHPYDFDPDEPFHRVPGTRRWENRLLFVNRKRMFDRVALLLDGADVRPLRAWATDREILSTLPTFVPPSARAS